MKASALTPLQSALLTWLLTFAAGWALLVALQFFGEIVTLLVTAGLIAFVLNYPVSRLCRVRWLPRPLVAFAVYLFAAALFVLVGAIVVPPLAEQTRQLTANMPQLVESSREQLVQLQVWIDARNLPFDFSGIEQQVGTQLQQQAKAIASQGVTLALGAFSRAVDIILVLVISFYMLLEGESLWQRVTGIFATSIRDRLSREFETNLRDFFVGQLVLGAFMTFSLLPFFLWLQVPFALLFAVFIGVLELIPFVGATIGIGTVVAIVAALSGGLALKVLAIAIGLQQVKDNVVAPRVFGDFTGLNPVFIFAALLLGAKIAGLLGVILAIPAAGVLTSVYDIAIDPTLPPQQGSFFASAAELAANSRAIAARAPEETAKVTDSPQSPSGRV
ncbi:MAG: AI-2E family transporter [Cyanobacteria bacterium J06639_1]